MLRSWLTKWATRLTGTFLELSGPRTTKTTPRDADLTRRRDRRRSRLALEGLEDRTLLTAGLIYEAIADTPLTLRFVSEELQVVESATPSHVLATARLATVTDGVRVGAAGHNVDLTIDASVPAVAGGIFFDGGAGMSRLVGPGRDLTWTVIGPGTGHMGSPDFVRFVGVEQLVGAADNDDTFVLAPGGSLAAGVVGGDRGFDSMVIQGEQSNNLVFTASGPDSGSVLIDGVAFPYAGLEPIDVTMTSGGPGLITVQGNLLAANDLVLERNGAGRLQVRSLNGSMESVSFDDPTELKILMGGLNDRLTISSAIAFDGKLEIDGGLLDDTVTITGDVTLPGQALTVKAETIDIGAALSTRPATTAGNGGDIRLEGQSIQVRAGAQLRADLLPSGTGTAGKVELIASVFSISGLSPIDVFPSPNPTITVGAGAQIRGGEVALSATKTNQGGVLPLAIAADQKFGSSISITGATIDGDSVRIAAKANDFNFLEEGEWASVNNQLIQPVNNFIKNLIPTLFTAASVMIRKGTADVTTTDATIVSRGAVEITSTTQVDAKADAGGGWDPTTRKLGSSITGFVPLAVGYSEAEGISKTTLGGSTTITAAGDVVIGSETEAKARVKASTNVNSAPLPKRHPSTIPVALSFGAAVGITTANTVANTLVGENVQITSLGNVDVTADGNIKNQARGRTAVYIDGSAGSAVAIAADRADIQAIVDGTIRAKSISAVEAPRVGLELSGIDPATEIITLANHGFTDGQELLYLAEDPANAATKHGAIDGLTSGQTYRVQVIDNDHFQLVRGGTITLDPSRIDPASTQTLTRRVGRTFAPTASQVDTTNNTITLPGHGFTTGQAIEYYLGSADAVAIGGLENEGTYFVEVVDPDTIRLLTDITNDPAATIPVVIGGTTYYRLDLTAPAKTATIAALDPSADDTYIDFGLETIQFAGDHNLVTGQRVVYSTGGGAPIGGLADSGTYFAIKVNRNTIKLAVDADAAARGDAIDLTSIGTGTNHQFRADHVHILAYEDKTRSFNPRAAGVVTNDGLGGKITFATAHNWQTGDVVVYRTDPTIKKDVDVVTTSRINLGQLQKQFDPRATTIDGEATIDAMNDVIIFDDTHDFISGQRVVYSSGAGTPIGGLTSGTPYYAIVDPATPDRLQLATRLPGVVGGGIVLAGFTYFVVDISLGSASGTTHTLTSDPVDLTDNLLVVPGHSFFTGQKVTYQTGGATPVSSELADRGEYYVIRVDANRLRLATSRANAAAGIAVALGAGATGTSHNLITRLAVTRFDPSRTAPVVDLGADTIELPDGHGLSVGDRVRYTSADGAPVGGLADDFEYEIESVNGNLVQLRTIGGALIDLTPGAIVGLTPHSLTLISTGRAVAFDPDLLPTIDASLNTIWMPGNRFKAGERITYLSGGNTPIPGLIDGREYLVTPFADGTIQLTDATTMTLVDLLPGTATGSHGFERAARGTRNDSAIDGLEAGEIYYVTVVDATTIRLSETSIEAFAALPVDLEHPAGQPLTNKHTLQGPATQAGIRAKLEAENGAIADTRLGGIPTLADMITGEVAQDPKTFLKILKGARGFMTTAGPIPVTFTASVGLSQVDHDVVAKIGPKAVLTADTDVSVTATIEQKALVNVDGSITTENAKDGKVLAVGVSVARGEYDNTAQALVAGGATIDAGAAIAVKSDITYPSLIENLPFSALRFNPNDPDEGSVSDELGSLLGGTGGLNRVMNVWAAASGRTPDVEVSITGSIAQANYVNRSEAIIGAGAKINQDPAFHNPGQTVSVEADTNLLLINVAGVLTVELNENGILNATRGASVAGKAGPKTWRSSPISPFGNQAKTVGVGGTIFLQSLENHTIARIEEGAEIRTGVAGLTVNATENVASYAIVQTGGDSGKVGVSGSVAVVTQKSETVGQLESGVQVTGGAVQVLANSKADHVNVTGAVQMAREVGIGVSVGVTEVTRDTIAVIGRRRTASDMHAGAAGTLIDAPNLTVRATTTGAIVGASVAGAVVSDLAGTDLFFGKIRQQSPPAAGPVGVGVSGAVAVNTVTTTTQAGINDAGVIQLNGGELVIDADDRTTLFGLSGAGTLVLDKSAKTIASKTAVGIAGSFSWNTMEATTEAFVVAADLSGASKATITADRDGPILGVSVGISGVAAKATGLSASGAGAGSVSFNAIGNHTRAFSERGLLTINGPVRVEATDKSSIAAVSVAGAGAGADSKGGLAVAVSAAGAVAANEIANATEAALIDSTVNASGAVAVTAVDETKIQAVSGALTVSISIGKAGLSVAGGVGISVALNDIGPSKGFEKTAVNAANDTITIAGHGLETGDRVVYRTQQNGAAIGGLVDGQSYYVVKVDDDTVKLVATQTEALASSPTGIALDGSAAGTNHALERPHATLAYIDKSSVIAAGDVTVEARSTTEISSLALAGTLAGAGSSGAGIAAGFGGAAAGTRNTIHLELGAAVRDGSSLTANAGGKVIVTALDQSDILADTGGLSVIVAAGATGGGVAAGLGAAVALNTIGNSVKATIDTSTVTAAGVVTVTATSQKRPTSTSPYRIDALALGVGATGAGSSGAGLTGAFAGGGSVAINSVDNTVEASIRGGGGARSVVANGGAVTVTASDDTTIRADSGGFALAVAGLGGAGTGASAALGASYSENQIGQHGRHAVRAVIDSSNVTAAGNVALAATSTAVIETLSIGGAAAVTAGSGMATGAGAGAGAITINGIALEVEASIKNNSVVVANSGGNITLKATDSSEIVADAGGVAIAVAATGGTGGGVSAGVSVGAAVALNTIANDVQALIDASSVQAAGAVSLDASSAKRAGSTSAFRIDALAFGAAASIAASGSPGLTGAFSGAGSVAVNKVDNVVEAKIKASGGAKLVRAVGGSVTLSASDDSSIRADSGAFSVALAFPVGGTGTGTAVSLGASWSENQIGTVRGHAVRSVIDSSTVQSAGAMTLDSTSTASVKTLSLGGSLAVVGGTGIANGAAAGAGAVTINGIKLDVEASVKNGSSVSGADITLGATDRSEIVSDAGGLAVAVAASTAGTTGVGIAIGAAIASNAISNDVLAYIEASQVSVPGQVKVTAIAGAAAGEMKDFTSAAVNAATDTITRAGHGLRTGDRVVYHATGAALGGLIDGESYFVIKLDDDTIKLAATRTEAMKKTPTPIQLTAAGTAHALEKPRVRIDTFAFAGAAAAAGSGAGGVILSGAGAGAAVFNTIDNRVDAYVKNGQVTAGAAGALDRDVTLTARDDSTIRADAGGGALAISASLAAGTTVALSVGAALTENEVGTLDGQHVKAWIDSSTVDATGDVILDARSNVEVGAATFGWAGAGAGSTSGVVVGVALAGAVSLNTVTQSVEALVQNKSTITADRNVTLTAIDDAVITADAGGVAASVAVALAGVSAAASAGLAVSTNTIADTARARIDTSAVTAGLGVALDARSAATIESYAFGGAGALSFSATTTAVSVAAAGAFSTNAITNIIDADILSGGAARPVVAQGGNVTVYAADDSRIAASAHGGSIAVSITATPASPTVSVAVTGVEARNTITNTVRARVVGSTVQAPAGDVKVEAVILPTSNITTQAVAASMAVAISTISVAASGAGAGAINTIKNTLEASVDAASQVEAHGAVSVLATDSASIDSTTGAGALAVGLISAAIGISINTNDIDNEVSAKFDGVAIAGGAVTVAAETTATAVAFSFATSFAAAGGGAGGTATTTVKEEVSATVGPNAQLSGTDVTVRAKARQTASATAKAATVTGGATVGVSIAFASLTGSTKAGVQGTIIPTGNVLVEADHAGTARSETFALGGGIIGIGVAAATSTTTVSPAVHAFLDGARIGTAGSPIAGNVVVRSTLISDGDAKTFGFAYATGISGAGGKAVVTLNPEVKGLIAGTSSIHTTGSVTVYALQNYRDDGTKLVRDRQVSLADSESGSGGLFTGNGADSSVTATPMMETSVGASAVVRAGKDVTLLTLSSVDAESKAVSTAGGLVAIGAALTNTTANGEVKAYVDGDVMAGERASVVAVARHSAVSYSEGFALLIGSAEATAVTDVSPKVTASVGLNSTTAKLRGADAAVIAIGEIQSFASSKSNIDGSGKPDISGSKPEVTANVATRATLIGTNSRNITTLLDPNIVRAELTIDNLLAPNQVRVLENTTYVATLKESPFDGQAPTYSIKNGRDGALFTLDNATGDLSFRGAPDFESAGDADRDNVYEVAIEAKYPRGNTVTMMVRVRVLDVAGALHAEGSGASSGSLLDVQQVRELGDAAEERWRRTGLSAEQLAALDAVTYRVADLAPGQLAVVSGGVVTVDADAGWFVDATPVSDEEFGDAGPRGLVALLGSAFGLMDLFTVLLHELGHVLGLSHANAVDNVMYSSLSQGIRRLPAMGQATGALPGTAQEVMYATGDTLLTVSDLGTRYERVMADVEDTDPNLVAPIINIKSEAAPNLKIVIGAEAVLGAGPNDDVVMRIESNHTATAIHSNPDLLLLLGVVIADAKVGGTIDVSIGGKIDHGGSLTLELDSANMAIAIGEAMAVGPGAITGVSTTATVNPTVTTSVAADSAITVGGDFILRTLSEDSALAESRGTSIGTHFGVGVALASASVTPTVSTFVGDGADIVAGGSITIETLHNVDAAGNALRREARATAEAASGAFYAGGGGAKATAEASPNVSAYVHDTATLTAGSAGTITVRALANNPAVATAGGLGIGGVGIGVALADATASGTTTANIDGKVLGGQHLAIVADATDHALADTEALAGGILSGRGSDAKATVKPKVQAYLGDGSSTAVTGNVTVTADARPEGDARAVGYGGGGVDVGVSLSNVTLQPEARAFVGLDAAVNAGGSVTVQASAGDPKPPPSDTFNPGSDVDLDANTIRFVNHGLSDGDTVRYDNNGNTSVGGLTHRAEYPVLRVDADRVRLGTTFDAALVHSDLDTITFASPHGLPDGTPVVYDRAGSPAVGGLVSGQTYIVKVLDATTIKLQDPNAPLAPATPFNPSAAQADDKTLHIVGHGFDDGQAVTYHAPKPFDFSSAMVDVKVDASGNLITDPLSIFGFVGDNIEEENNDAIYLGRDEDNNGTIEGHGLADGELVVYSTAAGSTPIGGLTSGAVYAVVKVNDYQVKLAAAAASFDSASTSVVSTMFDTILVDTNWVDVVKVTYSAGGGTPIGGLTEGGVYFAKVIGTNASGHRFLRFYATEADANAGGGTGVNEINLTSLGSGTHLFFRHSQTVSLIPSKTEADARVIHTLTRVGDTSALVEGQTYYVRKLDDDNFQLAASSTAAPGDVLSLRMFGKVTPNTHTLGTEGVDLSASTGSQTFIVDLTSQPGGEHKLLGPGGVSLRILAAPSNDGLSSAIARGSSGKILGAEVNHAKVTAAPTVEAYLAGNTLAPKASIVAGNDVTVGTLSKLNVSAHTDNGTGGLVAIGHTLTFTDTDQTNRAYVGNNAVVQAGRNVTVGATTTQSARAGAVSIGGGFVQLAFANAIADIDYATDVYVGANANITAGDTLKLESVSTVENTQVNANADARGFGSNADANDAELRGVGDADGRGVRIGRTGATTETEVRSGAVLQGRRVELSAKVPTVNAQATSNAFAGGFGADSDALARIENTQSTLVALRGNAEVTGTDGVVIRSQADSTGTFARADATFRGAFGDTDATTINHVNTTATVDTDATATVKAGGADPVALFVDADTQASNNSGRKADKFGIDFGGEAALGGVSETTGVTWDADVVVLGGAGPELHVNSAGQIVKAVGVTVNGGQSTGTVAAGDLSVDDIPGGGTAGAVVFDTHGGTIAGSGGTWTFNDTAGTVRLTNDSDRRFVINDISLLSSGTPSVDLRARQNAVTLEFDIKHAVGSADIDIRNTGASDVLLNGDTAINNPLGRIGVSNTGGSILSAGPQAVLRANVIDLDAATDIGANTNRINVELVESFARPVQMFADAGRDAYLNLTARLRGPGTSLTVGLESLRAGRDANVLLQQTVKDTLGTGPAGGGVFVNVPGDPFSDTFVAHFRTVGGTPANLDPVFFADPSTGVAIDSVIDFDLIQAGRAIAIAAANTTAAAKRMDVTAGVSITGSGAGRRIDVRTTGDIALTQSDGNAMPVGVIESTTGKVDLLNQDLASAGQDIDVIASGSVKAATTARVRAGDDVTTAVGSLIQAATQITIEGDAFDSDTPGTTITINGDLSSPLTLLDGGNDVDAFRLTNANGVNAGLATAVVKVDGGGLMDSLLVSDAGDLNADLGSMTGTTIRGLGMGGDGVEYTGIEDIEVRLSQGGTSFNVLGTSFATKVLGGAGNDVVTVANAASRLDEVLGELTVDAAGGAANRLVVDHSGSATASVVTLTKDAITGFAPVAIRYAATSGAFTNDGIRLVGPGIGGNTFNVQSTLQGSTTRIEGGGQADTFKVFSDATGTGLASTAASQVQEIKGDLTLVGGNGAGNRLIVSDFANAAANTNIVVTSDRITGLAPATIFYSTATGGSFTNGAARDGILVLGSNAGGNTFNVQSTLGGSTTELRGNGVNSRFNVSSAAGTLDGIAGTLSVVGGTGAANRLVVSDIAGTTVMTNIVVTSDSITGFAPAAIHYSAAGQFTNGATGDGILLQSSATQVATFNVRSTLAGSTTKVVTGQANDTINVGNLANSLADIDGALTLDGSGQVAPGDAVFFNDQGEAAAGLVYDLTAATLTRTGLLTLAYLNLESVTLNTGLAAATVNVLGTADGVNTAVNGGPSDDVFNLLWTGANSNVAVRMGQGKNKTFVRSTGAGSFTSLRGGADDDLFALASNAADGVAPGLGSLADVRGVVDLDAGAGAANRLVLDNSTGPASALAVVTANSVTGLAPAVIQYAATGGQFTNGASGDGIFVLGSDLGADRFDVRGTLAGSTTRVITGQANDTVNVGSLASSLGDIDGALTLDGGGHLATPTSTLSVNGDSHTLPTGDAVVFHDQGEAIGGLVYDLTPTTLTRSGVPAIAYLNLESVTLNTGVAAATVNVLNTADGVNTTVNGGPSADVLNVLSTGTSSNVVINAAGGNDWTFVRSTGAGSFASLRGAAGDDLFVLASNAAAGVAAGRGSLASVRGVVAIDAGTGAVNRLVLDNSTGTPSAAVFTTPVVGQLGRITGLAPATIYHAATGGAFTNGASDGVTVLGSTRGANVFVVKGTLAGSTYQVVGSRIADSFNVGDTRAGNRGNLDLVRGRVTVVGNGGNDSLVINDRGAVGAFNYHVEPTRVRNDAAVARTVPGRAAAPARAFAPAGIIFNATGNRARDTVVSLRLDGTDQANVFSVTPSTRTTMLMNGNRPVPGVPVVGGGDFLKLNTTRFADQIGGRRLHITSPGNGYWTFTDPARTRPVVFESIERFNHVAIMANSIDPGAGRRVVVVRDAETGAVKFQVAPYASSFQGGVNVAVGDVNFDGLPDLITLPGANHAPIVRIYSGTPDARGVYRARLVASFPVFNVAFRSGASLAVADVNRDGAPDLIVGAGAGWLPQVRVFDGLTLLTTRRLIRAPFNAFEATFRGGVNVAAGDLNRDGFADIIATRATNGRSTVSVFSGRDFRLLKTFSAYGEVFRGGLSVAVGDYNGDRINDIIVGTGPGTAPRVLVLNGATLFTRRVPATLRTFLPGSATMGRGVRVKTYAVGGGDIESLDRVFVVAEMVGTPLAFAYSIAPRDRLPRV